MALGRALCMRMRRFGDTVCSMCTGLGAEPRNKILLMSAAILMYIHLRNQSVRCDTSPDDVGMIVTAATRIRMCMADSEAMRMRIE